MESSGGYYREERHCYLKGTDKGAMVTKRERGKLQGLLKGYREGAMGTEIVQGRAPWLLRGYREGCQGY